MGWLIDAWVCVKFKNKNVSKILFHYLNTVKHEPGTAFRLWLMKQLQTLKQLDFKFKLNCFETFLKRNLWRYVILHKWEHQLHINVQ